MSGVDHVKVDILASPLFQPPLCEVHLQKKRPQEQSERFPKIELESGSLVEGALQGTEHTIALSCGGQSDTGIRERIRATGCYIELLLPYLESRKGWKQH